MARIDHVVVFVNDLDEARQQYEEAGFTVLPGGVHAGGRTHNVLIPFADGSYLEILGHTEPDAYRVLAREFGTDEFQSRLRKGTPLDRRFLPRAAVGGTGLADMAVGCTDMESLLTAADRWGFHIRGPFSGARKKPDGSQISWKLAFPDRDSLPFLIEDVTARDARVADVDETFHPNTSVGISGVEYDLNDADTAALARLAEALELDVRIDPDRMDIELHGAVIRANRSPDSEMRPRVVQLKQRDGTSSPLPVI